MHDRAKEIYRKAEAFYRQAYDELAHLAETIRTERDLEELADTAYALRESVELLNRMRVRMEANQKDAERLACLHAVQSENIEPIKTEYCTATVDMQTNVRLPKRKKDPEGYAAVMTGLGVPRELWDRGLEQSPVVDLHWPGLVELVTERAAAGLPLPGGVSPDQTSTMYRLKLRRRRGILGDSAGF